MTILVPWLVPIVEEFNKNSLHHAHLISGPKGVGKNLLTSHFAKLILCQSDQHKLCEVCYSCKLKEDINHPDLHKLEILPDKKLIGISQIMTIRANLYESSFLGKNKVAIIPNLEKISLDGLNAILKILEEPPKDTYFLLTTDFLNQIPLTIQSRCFDLKVDSPSKNTALDWLNNFPKKDAMSALDLTNQRPFLAKELLEKNILNTRKEFIEEISLIIKEGGNLMSTSEKWVEAEDSLTLKLEWMSRLLCDSIKFNSDLNIPVLTEDTDNISKYLASNTKINNLHNLLFETNKMWNLFSKDTNLRRDYQLNALFVEWERDLGISKKI